MEKSIWKSWIRSTAVVCIIVVCLEVVLSTINPANYNFVYAEDSKTTTEWYPSTIPTRVKTDSITLNLSEYNLPNRVIEKEKLNDTGVKILYDDGSWLYLHEYMNVQNDYNMGMIKNENVLNPKHIVGFEVAPGYEAILRDGTKLTNGEEHKTRILGPLRLLGRSEQEYLNNDKYKEKDGKKGSVRDEKGEYELNPSAFQNASNNKGGFNYKMANSQQFSKLWDYNWSDILSREHKAENAIDIDVRNDVKMFNIKSIMVKKTTLKEGVYLMRGVFNVLNGETAKDMDASFNRGIFEYISPSVDEDDPQVMYYADETKTNGSVNGIMVVGNYEVNMQRKRSKAIIGKESEQSDEYLVIRGSKNKAVVITDSWKLNYGYRGIDSGKPTYSTSLIKGMLNANVSFLEESSGLIGLITGRVKTNNALDVIKGIVVSATPVGIVKGIIGIFKKLGETREVKPYYNDFVNLTITKRADNSKESNYDNCVYFKDGKDPDYALTRKGNKAGIDELSEFRDNEIFQIQRYDTYVKFCDLSNVKEEPVVTAYTKRNFKGNYYRFCNGETNNIGKDKEIETIKSLEIAPNTKVIFSDQEDCYHEGTPNYGSIGRDGTNGNALVVEGPAYISDLDKYLDSCYIKNGNLETYSMTLKSFRVQHAENTSRGFSIYKEIDGIGTFEDTETFLGSIKPKFTQNSLKDALTVDNLVGKKLKLLDYYPQSISIRGNYFVKLYDKNGNLTRTIIGPVQNYNLRLDEENEQKERDYSSSYNENRLFRDNNPTTREKIEMINLLAKSVSNEEIPDAFSKIVDKLGIYKYRSFGENFKIEDYYTRKGEDIVSKGDLFEVELERIVEVRASYDELTTKALDYLKDFAETHKGTSIDAEKDKNIKEKPTKEESIRIVSRAFLDFYKKKSKRFYNDLLEKYFDTIMPYLYDDPDYKELRKKYKADKMQASTMMGKTQAYKNDIKNMYTNYRDMNLVINNLTQRDQKSRNLENVDGVILYQGRNYNEVLGGAENVWTRIPKSDLISIDTGESKGDIKLSRESGLNMEVEYDNINSIKITGALTGLYQLVIKAEGGMERKTRYSIPNLKEFFGRAPNDTLKIVSIRLDKVADTKDLEILLDTSGKTNNETKVSDFKIINTTEERVQKEKVSVKEESTTTEREVYMVSLFDVLDSIGADMEYLYKYDITGNAADQLVGVKITRNIGKIGSTTPYKAGDNKEIYTSIDRDIDKIVREVEVKFNKMSIEDIFRSLEFTVSNEYEYTDESRGLIITDHGYLIDGNEEIEVDNAVVTRYYKDVLEVPPMFIKEDYREVLENGKQVLENGKPKTMSYMREVKEYEVEQDKWQEKDAGADEQKDKKFLYVPVCYKEKGKVFTSYLFEQLGIKASVDGKGIKLNY